MMDCVFDARKVVSIRRGEDENTSIIRTVSTDGMTMEEYEVGATMEQMVSGENPWGKRHFPIRVGADEYVARRAVMSVMWRDTTVHVRLVEIGLPGREISFVSSDSQKDADKITDEVCAKACDVVVEVEEGEEETKD